MVLHRVTESYPTDSISLIIMRWRKWRRRRRKEIMTMMTIMKRRRGRKGGGREREREMMSVSWYVDPSQPQRITTSGLGE